MELEIQLVRAETEAEKVKAEAERTKIAAVGEALKQLVEQPGPKAALEGLGAMLHAQAQIAVNQEQHTHEQLMQDKRDSEAQRQREWKRAMREQLLGSASSSRSSSARSCLLFCTRTGKWTKLEHRLQARSFSPSCKACS